MSWSLRQSNSGQGSGGVGNVTVNWTSTPLSGSLLVAIGYSPNSPASNTFASNTGGASWTTQISQGWGNAANTADSAPIGTAIANGTESSVKFTTTSIAGNPQMVIAEFTHTNGALSSVTLDGTPTGNSSGTATPTSLSAGSITLTNSDSLMLFDYNNGAGSLSYSQSNSTGIQSNVQSRMQAAYWIPGSTGSKSDTATITLAEKMGASAIAVIPPSAPSSTNYGSTFMSLGIG